MIEPTEYAWIYTGPNGPISARVDTPDVPWDQDWYDDARDDLGIGSAACRDGGYGYDVPIGWIPMTEVRDGAAMYRRQYRVGGSQ